MYQPSIRSPVHPAPAPIPISVQPVRHTQTGWLTGPYSGGAIDKTAVALTRPAGAAAPVFAGSGPGKREAARLRVGSGASDKRIRDRAEGGLHVMPACQVMRTCQREATDYRPGAPAVGSACLDAGTCDRAGSIPGGGGGGRHGPHMRQARKLVRRRGGHAAQMIARVAAPSRRSERSRGSGQIAPTTAIQSGVAPVRSVGS